MQDATQQSHRAAHIASSALGCTSAQRDDFVATACGDDTALRHEVEWLLDAAESTMTDPLAHVVPPIHDAGFDKGDSVRADLKSDYHISRLIGEGGMGAVYLAQRVVGDVAQPVALKFLHGMVHEPKALERFSRERRILARLEHANIARLIDGGTTADGRPFLAMEYVEGERIDTWCDKHKLSLRERLKLFLKVCTVVDYAHQRLVIHRDLKPANILVDADAEPRLLDFGIARLMHNHDAADLTETGQFAMTPGYASPEQIRGEPLSTATDLWSLSVLLYRLTCGVQPFTHDMPHKVFTAVLSGVVMPPGRKLQQAPDDAPVRAAREACAGRLPRDIDAIIMNSLRADTEERYSSVAELSSDIRRFLHTQPVRARNGQRMYRMRLFAWRYRMGIGLALLLMLVAGSVAFDRYTQTWSNDYQRTRAQTMTDFISGLFDQVHASQDDASMTGLKLLDNGVRQLDTRTDINTHDRTSLLLALAHGYSRLGRDELAEPLLKQALNLLSTGSASLSERSDVLLRLSDIYARRGDHAMAAASARVGRGLLEVIGVDPGKAAQLYLVEMTQKAYLPGQSNKDLLHALVRSITITRYASHARHARALDALSVVQTREQQLGAAEHSSREALSEAEKAFGEQSPQVMPYRMRLAMRALARDHATGLAMLRSLDNEQTRWRGSRTVAYAIVLRDLTQSSRRRQGTPSGLELLQKVQTAITHVHAGDTSSDMASGRHPPQTPPSHNRTDSRGDPARKLIDTAADTTATMPSEHVLALNVLGTMLLDGHLDPAAVMAALGIHKPVASVRESHSSSILSGPPFLLADTRSMSRIRSGALPGGMDVPGPAHRWYTRRFFGSRTAGHHKPGVPLGPLGPTHASNRPNHHDRMHAIHPSRSPGRHD